MNLSYSMAFKIIRLVWVIIQSLIKQPLFLHNPDEIYPDTNLHEILLNLTLLHWDFPETRWKLRSFNEAHPPIYWVCDPFLLTNYLLKSERNKPKRLYFFRNHIIETRQEIYLHLDLFLADSKKEEKKAFLIVSIPGVVYQICLIFLKHKQFKNNILSFNFLKKKKLNYTNLSQRCKLNLDNKGIKCNFRNTLTL